MNIKKIFAIVSTAALVFASVTPAFADTITISGNGSDSNNNANVSVTQTTQVSQSNSATISNNVSSSANSGDNNASHNTGGDASVDTGNAKTNVTVNNAVNSNVANVSNCGCSTGDLDVNVTGNGDKSQNTANTQVKNQTELTQTNSADVNNNVKNVSANSGDNHASDNTGGSVSVSTGNATTNVSVTTNANQNVAQVGNGDGSTGSTDSVIISGNGSDSHNKVNLGLTDWVVLGQTNSASVDNNVYAKSNTGKNTADDNTGGQTDPWGGDVTIDTGNAVTNVSADTAVNFNDANVGCDCLMDVTAKIAGNGASDKYNHHTDDTINADLTNGQQIGQANSGDTNNDLNGNSKSGDNKINSNTGATSDPSVSTGDSSNTTDINNQGNANFFGTDVTTLPFPWSGSNTNVTLTFSLQDLLNALHFNM
ncbi:MAG TPA: hypothetical protein VG895_02350 [Patescibacteria group bacterium]|nr:hypothetical protein [Patescibacteria group bacterium]